MTTPAVDQLLYLLDVAFAGDDWHSLLGNLRTVAPQEWRWVPPGGRRSIRDIAQHVGGCKVMYENHAFGDAALGWDHPLVTGGEALGDPAAAVAWLRAGHARLHRSVAGLDDAELNRPRLTNWGERKETRWIVAVLIQEDLYHAGEINHLRALHGGEDRWAYERESQAGRGTPAGTTVRERGRRRGKPHRLHGRRHMSGPEPCLGWTTALGSTGLRRALSLRFNPGKVLAGRLSGAITRKSG